MNDDNKNQALDIGKTVFSLFSFKTKMIIIGIVIFIFIIVIIPVVAMMTIFTPQTKNSSQKKGGDGNSSSSASITISVNEVIGEGSLVKYENATFPMPFETWDKGKDVVTSQFSNSRTITVKRSYTNKSSYGN